MDVTRPSPEDAVVLLFLETFHRDTAAGRRRRLVEYIAEYPGFEETIALEFARLLAEDGRPPSAGATDRGPPTFANGSDFGPYHIEAELGRGGQAVVYRARDARLGRPVALKILRAGLDMRRFEREARIAAGLQHRGVCMIFESGTIEGFSYISMQLIEGPTLRHRLDSRNPAIVWTADLSTKQDEGSEGVTSRPRPTRPASATTSEEIRAYLLMAERIARSLHVVHSAGVVHRDLKPGNIMLDIDEQPVITDFGLAGFLDRADGSLTHDGDFLGTPQYCSPEQIARQSLNIDHRTDIWSLGVTLFECVAGRRPFDGPTRRQILDAIAFDDPPPLRKLNRSAPRDLQFVLETCLEKDPERRYQSAESLADDLRRVLAHEPVIAKAPRPWVRLRHWVERRPAVASLTLGLFAVLVATIVIVTLSWRRERTARAGLTSAQNALTGLGHVIRPLGDYATLRAALAEPASISDLAPLLGSPRLHALRADGRDAAARLATNLPDILRAIETTVPAGADANLDAVFISVKRLALSLVKDIERIKGLFGDDPSVPSLAQIEMMLAMERLEAKVLQDYAGAWEQCIARLRRADLNIVPQPGLIPLGEDPDSGLEEFAAVHPRLEPAFREQKRGRIRIGDRTGLVFVLIPGGSFTMSEISGDPTAGASRDTVTLAPFLISKYELTWGQWTAVWRAVPSTIPESLSGMPPSSGVVSGRGRFPVDTVSLVETQVACFLLGSGIPTEAQWEFAARAGSDTTFWCGNDAASLVGVANLADASLQRSFPDSTERIEVGFDDGWPTLAPSDSLEPNAFGLHNVHGNVAEWVLQPFCEYRSFPARPKDGYRPVPPEKISGFVVRGGSFLQNAAAAALGARERVLAGTEGPGIGVRPLRLLYEP